MGLQHAPSFRPSTAQKSKRQRTLVESKYGNRCCVSSIKAEPTQFWGL